MYVMASHPDSDNPVYYLVKSFRDEQGRHKTAYIETIGKKSDLLKEHEDLDKFLKEYALKRTLEEKAEESLTFTKTVEFKNELTNQSFSYKPKNIGFLYFLSIYNSLNLNSVFDKYLENKKIKYDLNKINQFLIFSRILSPTSKKSTFDKASTYLYNFDDNLHDIYRALTDLNNLSNQIQTKIYKESSKLIKRDTSILYYDCTNFYFEIEDEDDDKYEENSDDILQYGFRKYGVNKEHRPNPIVQMGLFMDGSGLPLSFCLNKGNLNEQLSVAPLEKQMATDFRLSKFIFCSDAGLCSKENKLLNSKGNRAYLVTQSLKKLSNEQKEEIFSDTNWFFLDDHKHLNPISLSYYKSLIEKEEKGMSLTSDEQLILSKDIIYKEIPNEIKEEIGKKKELTNNYNVVKRNIYNTLRERILITFSKKYFLYQTRIFNKQLDRANRLIKTNKKELHYGPNDIRRFVNISSVDDNGEVGDKTITVIDSDKVEEEKKYHGFYAMATNLEDDINELLELNKRRWKIENLFRTIKSFFKARPVYLWTEEHIRAHFLICYEALFFYTYLENKLNEGKEKYTTKEIIEYLKEMNLISIDNLYYRAAYEPSSLLTRLENTFNLGLNKENYKLSTIKKYVKM